MSKKYTLSISKIKVLNGYISEGFPKLKVKYLLTINGTLIGCSQIINDPPNRNWEDIEKILLKQYI